MFSGLWPGFDTREVPISSVTNGVHVPSWVDPEIADFARSTFGAESILDPQWNKVYDVPDTDIWALRRSLRSNLVDDVRQRLRSSWKKRGAADAELTWTDSVLDPDVLTIGFARRVPTYKRLTLMPRNPARLKALLLHPEHPIQLVIAGKSHPADEQGKRMIQDLVRFTDDPEVRHRIVFLPNYDIAMARTLFPGRDVWLNNPPRPLEACGTSGMKAAINGGLNLSVLDGWWDEMYDGDNGWAIPTANNGASADERDDIEAAALYDLLETQVGPRFYSLVPAEGAGAAGPSEPSRDGVPHAWIAMIKHTMATLGPAVSAERMPQDYVEKLYRPAWRAGQEAAADQFSLAKRTAAWRSRVQGNLARCAGGARRFDGRVRRPADRRFAHRQRVRLARWTRPRRRRGRGGLRPRTGQRRAERCHGRGPRRRREPRRRTLPVHGWDPDRPLRVLRLHRAGVAQAHDPGHEGGTGARRQRLTGVLPAARNDEARDLWSRASSFPATVVRCPVAYRRVRAGQRR